jgi:hypothetical protein
VAEIPEDFGSGGVGLTPESGGTVTLAQILRDLADDVHALQLKLPGDGPLMPITAPDATDAASAAVLATELKNRFNELISILNAQSGATLKTTKA